MGEKTLLVELEKDKEKIVEKKLARQRQETEKRKAGQQDGKDDKKYSNVFSSKSFKNSASQEILKIKKQMGDETEIVENKPAPEEEIKKLESKVSATIEKPNYDYIEGLSDGQREKIFKIERQEEIKSKSKPSRLRFAILGILFALFGVWGLVNIAQIDSVGAKIAEVAYQYEINLPKYLKKLTQLDATSSKNMENLFETIPDEDISSSEIIEKSNWFDRFCNFIAGLLGG